MRLARRLFVVPLADNDHGKTSIMRSLLSQAEAYDYLPGTSWPRKDPRVVSSSQGRLINSYMFPRSCQETEKPKYNSVIDTLDNNDNNWRSRELIIMPSHVSDIQDPKSHIDDIDQMIAVAHSGGFDAICASVMFCNNNLDEPLDLCDCELYDDVHRRLWDERWTIPNKWHDSCAPDNRYLAGQLDALGRDLWSWISKAIAP